MRHHKVTLSPQYVQQCLEIIDELCKYKTASIYVNPVDPVRDKCPDYYNVVKTPMDFTTIRAKLSSKSYSSISEWKRDVYLIFSNSKLYNSKDSLYGMTAKFLQRRFNELVRFLSDDGWQKKLDFLQEQLKYLVENRPKSLPNPYFSASEIESRRLQLFPSLQIFGKRANHHFHIPKKVRLQKDENQVKKTNKSKLLNDRSKDLNKNKIKVAKSNSMLQKNFISHGKSELKSIVEPKKREENISPVITASTVKTVITAPENTNVVTTPTIKKFHLYDQNSPFNDHSNIFKTIGPNKVNKILSSRVFSHSVQSGESPINSKKNSKKETNNASLSNSNQNTINYANSYKNSRNIKSNNDSDSSDDIFVLDD